VQNSFRRTPELNRWPRTHKKYESAMGSERVQVSDTARSASLAHHLKRAVYSLLSGAVQTASEWLIEGIKGLCGRDA